jgi:hypothetical protein
MINRELLYPSVVPRGYLVDLGVGACSYADLGPNLIVLLSLDMDSALRNVAPLELAALELSEDQAWELAMTNLGREVSESRLLMGVASFEDGGKAAFFDGHWLGSAAIYHAGLYPWFRNELGAHDLYALVSERDSAVIFARQCSAHVREQVEQFSAKAAAHSRKPFGRNLFLLDDEGPVYVT